MVEEVITYWLYSHQLINLHFTMAINKHPKECESP